MLKPRARNTALLPTEGAGTQPFESSPVASQSTQQQEIGTRSEAGDLSPGSSMWNMNIPVSSLTTNPKLFLQDFEQSSCIFG